MIRRRSYFTAAGALALAGGIGLRLWVHGSGVDFASGLLMGMSIALLILGLGRARGVSR